MSSMIGATIRKYRLLTELELVASEANTAGVGADARGERLKVVDVVEHGCGVSGHN